MRDLFIKVCKRELKTLPLESGLVLVPDQNVKGGGGGGGGDNQIYTFQTLPIYRNTSLRESL